MIESGTQEWHAARARGIGGSDWTNILEIEPYGCRRKVWNEKAGIIPSYPQETTGPMERGTKMEGIVAAEAAEHLNRDVRNPGTLARAGRDIPDWLIGNLDRMIVSGDDGRGPGVLELKTANEWVFRKMVKAGRPQEGYRFQTQHYLWLSGWSWGVVFVLEPSSWAKFHFGTEPDFELLSMMRDEGDRFWKSVVAGDEPSKLKTTDARCGRCPFRLECHGDEYWDTIPDTTPGTLEIVEDPVLEDLAATYDNFKGIEAEAKAEKDKIRGQIIETLGGPRKVLVGPYKLNLFETSRTRFDRAGLKKKHPEVEKEFTRPGSTSQTLRVDGGIE